MSEEANIPDIFRAYEEGKHRRYNLLFAVNGGAFAVAELFTTLTKSPTVPDPTAPILGSLTLSQLSLGMALFTIVMILDIFMFGERMREESERENGPELFGQQGKLVLISIGLLIVAGWTLVSFRVNVLILIVIVYLGSIAIVQHLAKMEKSQERD